MADRKDELDDFIKRAQESFTKELHRKDIEPEQIIVFGPGAMLTWKKGRQYFGRIQQELQKKLMRRPSDFGSITFHWLGYPQPDSPYPIQATLSSVDMTADGIRLLVNRYPHARFHFICHSLMGLVAVYWALRASPNELVRVLNIITINSPLQGSEEYAKAVQRFINGLPPDEKSIFGDPNDQPALLDSLHPESVLMNTIREFQKPDEPFPYLLTIGTTNDPIVLEKEATCTFADDHYSAVNVRAPGLNPHIGALLDSGVITKIIETLRPRV